MAHVSIGLTFMGNAEEAFNLYKKAFGTAFSGPVRTYRDNPPPEGAAPLSETEGNKLTHVALPILGGLQIMGNDILESASQTFIQGNNFTISVSPDTKEEADRLYSILSEGGTNAIAPHEEFWGYWGTCKDRFGIHWMFNIIKQWQQ